MRDALIGICLAVILTACGGGPMTLSEYATQAETLVMTMRSDFATLDAEWESQTPTLEGALDYWDHRLAIRAVFLEGVEDLDPPAEVVDQHQAALDVFRRITAADEALAARVAGMDAVNGHRGWLNTPEGQASLAVLDEVYAFCRSAQAQYDATEEREALEDVEWLPGEMQEVVKVAFGCPP